MTTVQTKTEKKRKITKQVRIDKEWHQEMKGYAGHRGTTLTVLLSEMAEYFFEAKGGNRSLSIDVDSK